MFVDLTRSFKFIVESHRGQKQPRNTVFADVPTDGPTDGRTNGKKPLIEIRF